MAFRECTKGFQMKQPFNSKNLQGGSATAAAATADQEPLSPSVQKALEITKFGCEELLVESDWVKKLVSSEKTGKPRF